MDGSSHTAACACTRPGFRGIASTVTQRVIRGILIGINVAFPAAAGSWLASHGHILDVVLGLGVAVILPIVWPLVGMRPAAILTARLTSPSSRANDWVVLGAGFGAALWNFAILAAWTLAVFRLMGRDPRSADLPALMVWAYGVVLAPITALAPKNLDLGNTRTLALLFTFGVAVLCGFGFIAHRIVEMTWSIFGLTMAAASARAGLITLTTSHQRRVKAVSDQDLAPPPGPASPPGTARKATKRAAKKSDAHDARSRS